MKCNPTIAEDKGWSPPTSSPSVYVGETAKSLYERGKEHWYSFKIQAEDSHILKHHQLHHGGEGEPQFHLRPVRFFRTALTRQIHEAVRIQRYGEDIVLNSKGEYNRCKIGRLTLGEDWKDKVVQREEVGDQSEEDKLVKEWEKERTGLRRAQEIRSAGNLGRGLVMSPSRKRTSRDGNHTTNPTNPTTPGDKPTYPTKTTATKRRKLKYPVLEGDWGIETNPSKGESPTNQTLTSTNQETESLTMEDDQDKKEDDRKEANEEDDLTRKRTHQGRSPFKRLVTQTSLDPGINHQGGAGLVTTIPPESQEIPDGQSSSSERAELGNKGHDRATVDMEKENSSDNKESITVALPKPSGITVKGKLVPRQQVSGRKLVKKNAPEEEKTTQRKGRKKSTTVPPSGQITNFFKKKATGVEEEGKKTTFMNREEGTTVKESIRMFRDLEKGEDCVIRSGMCSKHNAKLKKSVKMKKMSVLDNRGNVTWTTRETVILVCPYKPELKFEKAPSLLKTTPESESDGDKGISKKLSIGVNDNQSHSSTKKLRVEEDNPLDRRVDSSDTQPGAEIL